MKFTYTKEIRKDDKVKTEVVETDFDVKEYKDYYETNANISEWEDVNDDNKRNRYVCLNYDKNLVINGDLRINGFINCTRNLIAKGVYRVGETYASN